MKNLPGKPDIVLPRYSAAVFVNGCFWHQHEKCRDGRIPDSNRKYWKPKLQKTQERDADHQRQLRENGWRVFVVWECEISSEQLDLLAHRITKDNGERSLH